MRHSSLLPSLWFLHWHKSRDAFLSRLSRGENKQGFMADICRYLPHSETQSYNSCHFVMRVSWGCHEDIPWRHAPLFQSKVLWLSVLRKLEPFYEVWRFHDYLVRNHFLGISPPNSWHQVLWWREWENERLEFYVRQTFDIFQLEANCKLNKKVRISRGWELRDGLSISIFQLVMSLSQYELVMIMNITFTAHR